MHHLDLIGAPSEIQVHLKKLLHDYFESHNVECKIHECNETEEKTQQAEPGYSTIKYMGHTLEFHNDHDISRKLPKLYLLIESTTSGKKSKDKKCINCDRCKCRDSLKAVK